MSNTSTRWLQYTFELGDIWTTFEDENGDVFLALKTEDINREGSLNE